MTRALFILLAWLAPALASAQVAVLRIDPQAEPFARELEAELKGVGLVADPGYLQEARAQAVDPTSDAALEMITPLLQLKLAVVPLFADANGIQLEYRDGGSGARLAKARIERDTTGLTANGREQLRRQVVTFLGRAIERTTPPPPPPADDTRDEAPADPALGDVEPERFSEAGAVEPPVRLRVHAGLGLGMRAAEWPRDGERQRVELGAFAAYDLGLGLAFALTDSLALVPTLAYQSALAYQKVQEPRVGAPADEAFVRAHRFAAVLGLALRLGGPGSLTITPALGFGVRNLRPEVHHLSTPAYSLSGPLVQLGVRLPLGERLALQLVPEAQWLLVGEGLRERGVEGSGVGLGGEATFGFELYSALMLELAYRQAHALLSGANASASDVERFFTLRAVGTL
jgi:hypothetical protein